MYSFDLIIAEHNATGGAALKQYVWLGDTPLAVFDNTTLYYVHPDHLDRPVVMTNASAMTIAWQAKYDPFGNPVAVTVSPVNNQRLPGQWFQSEDGLSYNWHRTYDPTLGRYTQADPLGFVDGPGLYNYAAQSPVMSVDPDGQIIPILIGIGAGFAFDYLLEKYKKAHCTCSNGTTLGPLGNAALGGAVGGTGPFYSKPRTGISGGGASGSGTSAASLGLHKFPMPQPARRFLRRALRKVPYLGLGLGGYELYDAYRCE